MAEDITTQIATWYHAVPLHERTKGLPRIEKDVLPTDVDSSRAAQRLARWRSQSPFTNKARFKERLAADGLNQTEFLYLLGETVERLQGRISTPSWLKYLGEALSYSRPENSIAIPEWFSSVKGWEFLALVEPLMAYAHRHLTLKLNRLNQASTCLSFDSSIIGGTLLSNLLLQWIWMISRTLALELQVASLQQILEGESPEERFQSYITYLRQPEVQCAILTEYPVLAQQLMIHFEDWLNASVELLEHLVADWDVIHSKFTPESDPGNLVHVEIGRGDKHQRGRSVSILTFSSGFRLVYKPRSVSIDLHFQELLSWLNERGDHPPFRLLNVLDRGTHGWIEFVSKEECGSLDELERFYERQGAYLSLLYVLEATDFHYENIIASGEHPILIDLESLFHPRNEGGKDDIPMDPASTTLMNSVLRVGLLPMRVWPNEDSEGIDISGLGATPGQLLPNPQPDWDNVGTDQMRLIRQSAELRGEDHLPQLKDNEEINIADFTEAIVRGFRKLYQLLLEHRDDLLSKTGPLAVFNKDEARVILRPTRAYALLLRESFHPDLLRDALDRDCYLDRLWTGIGKGSRMAKMYSAERDDLLRGDIPIFRVGVDSCDLLTSTGQRFKRYFPQSGMDMVRHRLLELCEHNLQQQIWICRASLATWLWNADSSQLGLAYQPTMLESTDRLADQQGLLEAASAVADRVDFLAHRDKDIVLWIGLSSSQGQRWSLRPCGFDLYNGSAGIALFLGYLSMITGEERYKALAQTTLTTMRRQVEESPFLSIGGFSGLGGVIHTLTHLSRIWNQSSLLAEAEQLAARLPDLIEADREFDVLGGAAGCIGALLNLYQCDPSADVLKIALQCGDKLVKHAEPMETAGYGWTHKSAKKPLAGFSHGAAGMAWALLKLAAVTEDDRFQRTALCALEYERSLFDAEVGNWRDLRELETLRVASEIDGKIFTTAWCHGAPGIGLARLATLDYLDDSVIRSEIAVALDTTISVGFGLGHSLCHGALGNLEFILRASQILDDPQLQNIVYRKAGEILEGARYGWMSGAPAGIETPGLMLGLAGIGYELLRLAEPTKIPSILTLEPPLL